MMHRLLSILDKQFQFDTASAHCDIPCGIYDPSSAQIAALTILRMVNLIEETAASDASDVARLNTMSRHISIKEEHGIKVKDEISVIWGDYFKQPQMDKFPEIHSLTHEIMMLASQSKQQVDAEKAQQLVDKVNRFAEIFWATKDVKIKRAICPYPPAVEVVYPDL